MTQRLRNAVFTLNNYKEKEVEALKANEFFSYIIFGKEVGKQGTPHLQGYAEFKRIRLAALNKKHFFNRAYLAARKGKQSEAIEYCRKQDKDFYERGTPNKNGNPAKLMQMIEDGFSRKDIAEAHPKKYLNQHSGIDKLIELHQPKRQWKMQVYILYGKTGTGKSFYANKHWPDAYHAEWPKGGRWWWPNYNHEEAVILDEFREQIPYDTMLRLLDRYPMKVEYKGGFTEMNSRVLIITTNRDPQNWYSGVKDRGPLIRRLNDYSAIFDCKKKGSSYLRKRRREEMPIPDDKEIVYDFRSDFGEYMPTKRRKID